MYIVGKPRHVAESPAVVLAKCHFVSQNCSVVSISRKYSKIKCIRGLSCEVYFILLNTWNCWNRWKNWDIVSHMATEILLIVEVVWYPSNELGIRGIEMVKMLEVCRHAIATHHRMSVDIIVVRSELEQLGVWARSLVRAHPP